MEHIIKYTIWAKVDRFNCLVSIDGEVLKLYIKPKDRYGNLRPKLNTTSMDRPSYWLAGRLRTVHRLIAEAFLDLHPDDLVRHLNDERQDNRYENIALGTSKDNAEDRKRNKGYKGTSVRYTSVDEVLEFSSLREAGSYFGCTAESVSSHIRRGTYKRGLYKVERL